MSYDPYSSGYGYGQQEQAEQERLRREELQRQLAPPQAPTTQPVTTPGMQPTVEPNPTAPPGSPANPMTAPRPAPQDYRSTAMDILGRHGYGHQALSAAAPELQAAGFQLQNDSAGQSRGRIKTPDGRLIDIFDPREGRTEQNNWFNNPVQGGQWAWDDRGHESQADAGGWSFGGPSGPASPLTGAAGSSFGSIQGLMPTDTNFYNQLQARLSEILGGPQAFDRQALLDRLKR